LRYDHEGSPWLPKKLEGVTLLGDIEEAAEALRSLELATQEARETLRERIRAARDEEIPFAAIARAAQLSRERVRQIYYED
jgi:DNA-directed RNA polymerase sigma subunit (sigma70/sigma32)